MARDNAGAKTSAKVRTVRTYPNNRVVMRPSEKFEAKTAGQKCSPEVVFSTLRTFLADNAGIGLPLGIERVIRIGS
ncbi:MAG: hypothetical protein IIC00_13560 [Planctomycetes bacterium]|nr:hypothetical protein [Planctomycetota bacterium]